MKHIFLRICTVLSLMLSMPLMAWSDDASSANKLFVAAVKAWNEADTQSTEDFSSLSIKDDRLSEVEAMLQRIIDENSGSDLALKLITGDKIGPISLESVKSSRQNLNRKIIVARCHSAPSQSCLFEASLNYASKLDEYSRNEVLGDIARKYGEAKIEKSAISTLRTIDPSMVSDHLFLDLGSILNNDNLLTEAFQHALKADTGQRNNRFESISTAMFKQGMTEEANNVLMLIDEPIYRDSTLSKRVEILASRGEVDAAVSLANSIESHIFRSGAFGEIAKAQARQGNLKESLATAQNIEDDYARYFAAIQIGKAMNDKEMIEASIDAILEAGDLLGDIALEDGVIALLDMGLTSDALTTTYKAKGFRREALLALIASSLARKGDTAQAKKIASHLKDFNEFDYFLNNLATAQAKSGSVENALSTVRRMSSDYDQTIAKCDVAEAIAANGDIEKALKIMISIDIEMPCIGTTLAAMAVGAAK